MAGEQGKQGCAQLPGAEEEEQVAGVSAQGLLLEKLFQGVRMKDAVKQVSALPGFSRNEVYKASLEVQAFLEGEKEE